MPDGQSAGWADEMFVDDDGSPETVWLTAEGRSALEAAMLVNDCIGLDGDGFGVSMVYGVIVPSEGGVGDWRFRKLGPEDANEAIAMWEVELA